MDLSLVDMIPETGLSVGAAWIAGQDRSMSRTLRPSAGQAQQWVSEWDMILHDSETVHFCSNLLKETFISFFLAPYPR